MTKTELVKAIANVNKITNTRAQMGGKDRAKNRSKTFPGIAKAIASQWGAYLEGI